MKQQITPCLWYDNQAREAAALYCAALADAKITAQSPIVSEITVSGQSITLLDGGPKYKPNPSISLFYLCETEDEFDQAWSAFHREGTVLMPVDKYPWSEKYGWINDKFGVSWQVALGKLRDVGQKVTASLLFSGPQYGRAEEAIDHYSSIFRDVHIDGILRFGADEKPEQEGTIKHAQLAMNGVKFMVMDSAEPHAFTFSEGVSLTIHCDTQEQIDHYWTKLTEKGGQESMCGWLKDKFGVSWQIVPVILDKIMSDPAKAGKAAQAFMSMKKLNIEQIVKASIS